MRCDPRSSSWSNGCSQVVFHAERGLEWVALAQKHQHAMVTALFTWSCATVTVAFYATFLPALICGFPGPVIPRALSAP